MRPLSGLALTQGIRVADATLSGRLVDLDSVSNKAAFGHPLKTKWGRWPATGCASGHLPEHQNRRHRCRTPSRRRCRTTAPSRRRCRTTAPFRTAPWPDTLTVRVLELHLHGAEVGHLRGADAGRAPLRCGCRKFARCRFRGADARRPHGPDVGHLRGADAGHLQAPMPDTFSALRAGAFVAPMPDTFTVRMPNNCAAPMQKGCRPPSLDFWCVGAPSLVWVCRPPSWDSVASATILGFWCVGHHPGI